MRQRGEPERASATQRDAAPLERVERVDVEVDEPRLREQRMRARREIRTGACRRRARRRRPRERVRGRRAGDADRARLQRMVPGQRALARLRLGHRHAVRFGERAQRVGGQRVEHAAARDDQRPLRCAQHRAHRLCELRRATAAARRSVTTGGAKNSSG